MARYSSILAAVLLFCLFTLGYGQEKPDKSIKIPASNLTPVTPVIPPTPDPAPPSPSPDPIPPSPTPDPIPPSPTPEPIPPSPTPNPTPTPPKPTPPSPSPDPKPTPPKPTPPSPTPPTPPPAPTPTPPAPAPAPTPAPGPLPPPDLGTWAYKNKTDNVTCILVQFAARLNVTYSKNGNLTAALGYAQLNVPANATVIGGSCGNDTQWIQISWPNNTWANNLTLQYYKNATTKQFALKYLNATLSAAQFPNASSNASVQLWHSTEEWRTPLATSYRCLAPTQLNMTETAGAVATLTITRLQEEAFRTTAEPGFSAVRDCGGGDVPDAVPIAVGCALGGLVVVVLVAYLVARRRSAAAARGYVSM